MHGLVSDKSYVLARRFIIFEQTSLEFVLKSVALTSRSRDRVITIVRKVKDLSAKAFTFGNLANFPTRKQKRVATWKPPKLEIPCISYSAASPKCIPTPKPKSCNFSKDV